MSGPAQFKPLLFKGQLQSLETYNFLKGCYLVIGVKRLKNVHLTQKWSMALSVNLHFNNQLLTYTRFFLVSTLDTPPK